LLHPVVFAYDVAFVSAGAADKLAALASHFVHEERMSKSSTVTVRETPVSAVATAESGGLTIHGETFVIDTDERLQLVDLTERIMGFVRQLRVREGVVSLWSMHTTCAVFINEFQTALLTDIKRFLELMVARDEEWRHNDPEHSDCDRMNADSHLRALLLGHSLTLQITGGEVVLGQWQRILMAELDGPRARTLRVQVMGIV
jgi:secondary thiamine-phosphate synthase enzyme